MRKLEVLRVLRFSAPSPVLRHQPPKRLNKENDQLQATPLSFGIRISLLSNTKLDNKPVTQSCSQPSKLPYPKAIGIPNSDIIYIVVKGSLPHLYRTAPCRQVPPWSLTFPLISNPSLTIPLPSRDWGISDTSELEADGEE